MKGSKVLTVFLLLVLSFMMPKNLKSQIMEVGVSGGLSYYIGDINPSKHFSLSQYAFGGTLRYYQNLRWAFRLQYSKYDLKSSDKEIAFMPERGISFYSKVNDFSFVTEFNFFDYWTGSEKDFITPYILAGISCFNFNTTAYEGTETLEPVGNKWSWSIPFGLGVKYSLSKRIGTTIEWRIHKTFTDEIDSVVDNIINDGKEEINESFGYKCDWIGTLELSIVYKFNLPRKVNCHSGITIR